ncbi:MAG: hypothetical protein VKI42_03055 [Synechococcaceae cyanobacterium]|nr:hypothetical protein [Synechococcaceae cyanobacterium]
MFATELIERHELMAAQDDDLPRQPEAPPWPWLVESPMARRLDRDLHSSRALQLP